MGQTEGRSRKKFQNVRWGWIRGGSEICGYANNSDETFSFEGGFFFVI